MYDTIISQICPELRTTAIRVLQFLAYAKRPLMLDELADALVVDPNESPSFRPRERMFNNKYLPDYCPGLIVLEKIDSVPSDLDLLGKARTYLDFAQKGGDQFLANGYREPRYANHWVPSWPIQQSARPHTRTGPTANIRVRLAHFSVTEYLRSHEMRADLRKEFEEPIVHSVFVELSLKYLLSLSTIRSDSSISVVRENYPFSDYASKFWPQHAKACEQQKNHAGISFSISH